MGPKALAQTLEQAMGFHQRGQLAEAERLYLQILQARPAQFEAQHLLGVLRGQQGRLQEAQELVGAALRANPGSAGVLSDHGLILHKLGQHEDALSSLNRALAIKPDHIAALNNRGNALSALQRYPDALASYDAALAIRPTFAEALSNRGNALAALGRYDEALTSYARALANRPDSAETLYGRGNALAALGRYDEALTSYDRALALRPDHAEALQNRGNALAALKRHDEALASYDRALALAPSSAEAFYNRAIALVALMRPAEALASYDRALAIRPDYAEALNGRGVVLHELGHYEEAIGSYDRATAIRPDYAEAFYNRGGAAQELDRHDEALASFDRALAIKPGYVEALCSRGYCLWVMNAWREALASYDMALALKPDDAAASFARCMANLPILYADEAEIAERRAAYERQLKTWSDEVDRTGKPGDLATGVGSSQPFYLAYQGLNDRDLQAVYGSLVCRIMAARYPPASLAPPPGADEPVRVGIVSGFFRQHSNWKIPIKGWLSQLDRRRFRLFGYYTGVKADAETTAAAQLCDRFVQGPLSLDRWREEIEADAPHVLIYPEVGMDPVCARLAAQRLARVQCNSWGHPDTSGFPTLDYYLSSDLMEPADGENHYTERLVRLPNLSIYYELLELPVAQLGRAEIGLRPDSTVYWCGQSLYKYLPQFDCVFPRIAREVGDCQFAFIQHSRGAPITELFRQRLERAFAADGLRADQHCVFLSRLDQRQFGAAIGLSDIFLDSVGWSGCNSTLESLPHDLPVVTMNGTTMRGRHGVAILKMMGVTETATETIDDYVSVAVRLAKDVPWRKEVKGRIAASKHRVYSDRACISALEEFLDHVARLGVADTAKPGPQQ